MQHPRTAALDDSEQPVPPVGPADVVEKAHRRRKMVSGHGYAPVNGLEMYYESHGNDR